VAPAPSVAAPPPAPRALRLVAVGDIIPHDSVTASAVSHGWGSLFEETRALVSAADLALANLETPIAPSRAGRVGVKVFNAPPALPLALKEAGFDGVSIANNHVWDQGRGGLLETVTHVDAAGLARAGAGRTCEEATRPVLLDVQGVRVGWIAASRVHNLYLNRDADEPCVFKYATDDVVAAAAAARAAGAELVVLSVHWGQEYEREPRSWERSFARELVAGGVDVVLGHHPHVLQPIEFVESGGRRGLVAFSLGNFVSGQGWSGGARAVRRDGVVLDLQVRAGAQGWELSYTAHPSSTEHGATACVGAPPRVRASLLDVAIPAADAAPATRRCAAYYRARHADIGRALGGALVGRATRVGALASSG
jgi:poly-gamma-glutamate synthesis protein (capsule biosynthesis protein)